MNDLNGILSGLTDFSQFEKFTGLKRRIECARLLNGIRRLLFSALTVLRNGYLVDVNGAYEDYKAATSDNGFVRLANKIRARAAFRAHTRSVKREIRDIIKQAKTDCVNFVSPP